MAKKILKILALVLVALAIGIYFSYDYWLEKELKYRLSEIINKDPNRLYQYSFSKLNINLMDGSVDLTGIVIEPSAGAFDSLMSEHNNLRFILQLNLDEIRLDGFEITEFITTGNIKVKALTISEPRFEYFFHPGKEQAAHAMPLSNVFSDKFQTAELGTFRINNAEIKIIDQTKSGPTVIIHHLNIELTEARMDSITIRSYLPFAYADLSVNAAGITIDGGKDFSIKSDSMFFKVKERTFGLKNFQVNPKYNQKNFTQRYDVQKQWFAIKLDSLILNNINIDTFVRTGHIEVGKIEIVNPNIALYKDKRKPPPPFKKKLLPASAIKSIPWVIEIDSVLIKNGYISINETSALTGKDSHLTFEELNVLLLNFNNSQEKNKKSTIMTLTASTLVLGKAATNIRMRIDLSSATDRFTVSGNVGRVEGQTFNSVLEPMMGVKVIGGTVNEVSFAFTANDTLSTGTLDTDYEGIKLEVLSTDSIENKKSKKGFMTFAANTAIKSNNIKGRTSYLQGVISVARVPEKDVWPYLWHSIQGGLVSTLAPFTNSKDAKRQQKEVRRETREAKKVDKQ